MLTKVLIRLTDDIDFSLLLNKNSFYLFISDSYTFQFHFGIINGLS